MFTYDNATGQFITPWRGKSSCAGPSRICHDFWSPHFHAYAHARSNEHCWPPINGLEASPIIGWGPWTSLRASSKERSLPKTQHNNSSVQTGIMTWPLSPSPPCLSNSYEFSDPAPFRDHAVASAADSENQLFVRLPRSRNIHVKHHNNEPAIHRTSKGQHMSATPIVLRPSAAGAAPGLSPTWPGQLARGL